MSNIKLTPLWFLSVCFPGEEVSVCADDSRCLHLQRRSQSTGESCGVPSQLREDPENPALSALHIHRQDPLRGHRGADCGGGASVGSHDHEHHSEDCGRPTHTQHGGSVPNTLIEWPISYESCFLTVANELHCKFVNQFVYFLSFF